MKSVLRIAVLGLVAGALAGVPLQLAAQNTNRPAAKSAASATNESKKPAAHPFHGKLAALDKMAKTITVGKSVYQITSETKIKKAGKPATLADGVVGEPVSGYVKPTADGKLVATTVTFGPRTENKAGSPEKPQKQ